MYSLEEIGRRLGATVRGDGNVAVTGVAPFEYAKKGEITLASGRKYWKSLDQTQATAVIVPSGIRIESEKPLLVVDQPKLTFARLVQLFHPPVRPEPGVAKTALIHPSARLAEGVSVLAGAVLGEAVEVGAGTVIYSNVSVGDHCRIGADCFVHPNVSLYPGVRIGSRVIIHSGTVIGADGFGYVFDGESHVKIPQTGSVSIEDEVEIGANCCIDRATFGETVLERGCKLDNHVHIGHNCRIGANTVIVGQVGLSGSVEVGRNCTLAGHVGIVDHVRVGDNVRIMGKSLVSRDVAPGSSISGIPGTDHRTQLRLQAVLRRLPEMYNWYRVKKGSSSH